MCAIMPWTVILRKTVKSIRYFSQPDYFKLVTYKYTDVFKFVCMTASPKAVTIYAWTLFGVSLSYRP